MVIATDLSFSRYAEPYAFREGSEDATRFANYYLAWEDAGKPDLGTTAMAAIEENRSAVEKALLSKCCATYEALLEKAIPLLNQQQADALFPEQSLDCTATLVVNACHGFGEELNSGQEALVLKGVAQIYETALGRVKEWLSETEWNTLVDSVSL